jgi:excisionase family DNA binding protein
MERRTYTVTEAATVLGISRTSAYERVRAGELPALRLGRRIVITRAVVDAMLTGAPVYGVGQGLAMPDVSVAQGTAGNAASNAGRSSVTVLQSTSRSISK